MKAVLERALARIQRGWTQRAYARRANGYPVLETDPRAVCWCAVGAIYAETSDVVMINNCRAALSKACGRPNTAYFNDDSNTKLEDVVRVYQEAIANAQ